MKKIYLLLALALVQFYAFAQTGSIRGTVTVKGKPLEFATAALKGTQYGTTTNEQGVFEIKNIKYGTYQLIISAIGYRNITKSVTVSEAKFFQELTLQGEELENSLAEVVVTGTMKEVSKLESAVPVEIYTPVFFKRNPVPNLFESLQNINGIRPQLNCNVCNTGDIHINGLEGPYTMIMIDGMPIVSGLSTVYGLSGIPSALIERVEVVKGPASTLYGSEAVGGLINVITKKPSSAPLVSADVMGTSWSEFNTDLGVKYKVGEKAQSLFGLNYFNFQRPIDKNGDGFTDITLQNRISLFNKISFDRKDNRVFSIGGRYVYENRWGGQMQWTPKDRGSNEVYAESIYTKRWEVIGAYQLPIREKITFQFSANGHNQDSYYGTTPFAAQQYIGFGQFTWDKKIAEKHDLLVGTALRYTYYDDSTPATSLDNVNAPSKVVLPGIFAQDEISLSANHKLLLGLRYDYNSIHGSILTPRLNYKWTSTDKKNVLRASFGNGYRVANVFTEDHAALTGARKVEFTEELKPERSWNGNLNYVRKFFLSNGSFVGLDATAFYTFFNNRIIPDYLTDPNKIIYSNLAGNAVSKGISLNIDFSLANGLKVMTGATAMDVFQREDDGVGNLVKMTQLLTEKFTGVWSVSYSFQQIGLSVDYTGNLYGPMKLPVLGPLDPRPEYSPWWSIQNIQLTKKFNNGLEIYGGVKNLLNFTPTKDAIARAFDPFDKGVTFDDNGQVVPTPNNPYALTFDPSYVYAPNQGIRAFAGVRYNLFK
ncbi:TonB-dependent receptor [Runella zeae]|uniref:TonB-dependent receptor n=1 Tax=Runella zeae TaxID=94255 RepID=UPI002354EA98|nr:TonB-dependent receptor [Runella zeae]